MLKPCLLSLAIASLLLIAQSGCATVDPQSRAENYYLVLGALDRPLVAATALTLSIEDPETRAALLHDIAEEFISRGQIDNGALVLGDATDELTRSSAIDTSFDYPVMRGISRHVITDGSLTRAQIYLNLAMQYQRIDEIDETERALNASLNELLLVDQGTDHHDLLLRFMRFVYSSSIRNERILSRSIEAVLTYREPLLYGDFLKFLIRFYLDNEQLRSARIFEDYARLLLLEYQREYSWLSLALHYSLREFLQFADANIARIRQELVNANSNIIEPFVSTAQVILAARKIATESDEDLVRFYERIEEVELRCEVLLSQDDVVLRLLASANIYEEIGACIDRRARINDRIAYARSATAFAIRNNYPLQDDFIAITLSGTPSQNIASYLSLAREYLAINEEERARFYLNELMRRYDNDIDRYQDAIRFANIYGRLVSQEEILQQLRARRDPLLRISLLLELARRERENGRSLSSPVIFQSASEYL